MTHDSLASLDIRHRKPACTKPPAPCKTKDLTAQAHLSLQRVHVGKGKNEKNVSRVTVCLRPTNGGHMPFTPPAALSRPPPLHPLRPQHHRPCLPRTGPS